MDQRKKQGNMVESMEQVTGLENVSKLVVFIVSSPIQLQSLVSAPWPVPNPGWEGSKKLKSVIES